MKPADLMKSLEAPCLHLIEADNDAFENLSLALSSAYPTGILRKIRGRKSQTVAAFFDESAAALQFPYYFGENWNAFDEVINDLAWLSGDAYLLLLFDAELLLSSANAADFRLLVEILAEAHDQWRDAGESSLTGGGGVPFHVLLQGSTAEAMKTIAARLSSVGAAFDVLHAPT